jgi:hypothetical protein
MAIITIRTQPAFWAAILNPKFQRGLSGQKPKHARFCIKGATTHMSLHQIGPNLALN